MRTELWKWMSIVVVGLMAMQLRCGKTSEPEIGDITGTVMDSITGEKLPGVTVSTDPATMSVHTSSQGEFTISGVPVGEYDVKYHKDAYQDAVSEQKIYVRKNEAAQADFQLRPLKGIVFGRITDAKTGRAVAGASITATPGIGSLTSDVDGNYQTDPIAIGSYMVTFKATDYKDASKNVYLQPGDRIRVDVQLEPSPSSKVTITRGPEDGATLSTSEVTFGWEGNTATYRYRVVSSAYYKDFRDTDESSVVLEDLDESPEHTSYTFEIVAVGEDGRESPPAARVFRVDAIRGPAVWLRSRRVLIPDPSVSPEFTLDVIAEEVVDLLMVHLVMRFDQNQVKIRGVDRGDFLSSASNPDHLLFFPSDVLEANSSGVLIVDMGVLQSNGSPAASGSGVLAQIRFSVLVRSQETEIDFVPETKLVDARNEDMALKAKIGARVEIR